MFLSTYRNLWSTKFFFVDRESQADFFLVKFASVTILGPKNIVSLYIFHEDECILSWCSSVEQNVYLS